jgi:hypothetical protein
VSEVPDRTTSDDPLADGSSVGSANVTSLKWIVPHCGIRTASAARACELNEDAEEQNQQVEVVRGNEKWAVSDKKKNRKDKREEGHETQQRQIQSIKRR